MIPADIKEMAKHDELVAELLAMGGPFMYKEYKMMREGRSEEIVLKRTKRTKVAVPFLVTIWGLQGGFMIRDSFSIAESVDWIGLGLGVATIGLIVGASWFLINQARRMVSLRNRILAGEFSTD